MGDYNIRQEFANVVQLCVSVSKVSKATRIIDVQLGIVYMYSNNMNFKQQQMMRLARFRVNECIFSFSRNNNTELST